ncbi:hypothetical protein SKAU_G00018960 [Synaphobranchus kaupii]|uniref:Uncharacterized protein n=1 Tax=Synaphobranchus kaupii TaxID=118154 RepID=A0A9Q1JCY0_SYNKA|nr:hypothetical protein SKAU_G00018960 [Synaphobranchus kaupii]
MNLVKGADIKHTCLTRVHPYHDRRDITGHWLSRPLMQKKICLPTTKMETGPLISCRIVMERSMKNLLPTDGSHANHP